MSTTKFQFQIYGDIYFQFDEIQFLLLLLKQH